MSSFPSRLVDLAVPRELFDHAGEMPPAFKMVIELPSEYFDQPAPGATPPYTSSKVDNNKLVEIQTAVMRKYNSVARRVLNSFRQDVGLSDNQIHMRTSLLGNGVGMKYASQFGNEAIAITVTAKAVRELMGGSSNLYMLVFYSGGIAAIPMDKIDTPSGNVKVQRSIASSPWLTVWSTQLKISADTHVIASPAKFNGDGTLSASPGTYFCNSRDSIYNGAESSVYKYWGNAPLLNWSKKIVYDNSGSKVDFSKSPPVVTQQSPWVADWGLNVGAVGSNGELWSRPKAWGGVAFVEDSLNQDTQSGPLSQYGYDYERSVARGNTFKVTYFGPGETDAFAEKSEANTWVLPYRIMVYSNNGSVDSISIKTVNGTFSTSTPDGPLIQMSLLGLSGSAFYEAPVYWAQATGQTGMSIPNTYMYGDTIADVFMTYRHDYNKDLVFDQGALQTPFGHIEDAAVNSSTGFNFFAANGKHSIIGFEYFKYSGFGVYTSKIYKNRKDYGDKLASALGVGVSDICSIFLDIKKSDIDKLK